MNYAIVFEENLLAIELTKTEYSFDSQENKVENQQILSSKIFCIKHDSNVKKIVENLPNVLAFCHLKFG